MKSSSFNIILLMSSIFLSYAVQGFSQQRFEYVLGDKQAGENFRIYPSNITQTESFIVTHPYNSDIMFSSANTINFVPFFISEGIYVTTNGGNSWRGSDTCSGEPIIFHGGDPGITIDKNGTFIITRLGQSPFSGLYSHYSTDLGLTWSSQLAISNDDLERAVLTSDVTPTSNHYGRTYAFWVKFAAPFPVQFVYTDNGGANWSAPVQLNNPIQRSAGGETAMGPNGRVYVCWGGVSSVSPFTEDFVGIASSTDGGNNWQVNENAFDINGIMGILEQKGNIRVNGLPVIAVDTSGGPRHGWIYIVTTQKNLSPAGSDPDIILNRSSDNGQSWSTGIRVNQDPINNGAIQYFPAIHVDKSGGVNIIYYNDWKTTSDSTGVFYAKSDDGGNIWQEFEISDHNFKPIPIGGLGQGYQGDNIAITSSNGKLWPVWMDNSSGIYQIWTVPIDTSSLDSGIVVVTKPNGGEIWDIGSTQHITWQSLYIDTIKIEYSTNNGVTWEQITSGYPSNSGDYTWIIPNTPSSDCRVKITDVQDPTDYDISNGTFTITEVITVIAPNGGELWPVGSDKDIMWEAEYITFVNIDYTTNNGNSWIQISASVPAGNGSYTWAVPNTVSSQCKVRISDLNNLNNNDQSDNVFSITPIPSITLLYPNGGESFEGTTTQLISYISTGVDSVMIQYSSNSGASWVLVYPSVPVTGNVDWIVPNISSQNCLIKVSDTEDINTFDISDSVFSILEVGWFQQNSNVSNRLNSVDMWNSMIGYSCGLDGTILRTTDGGFSWESLSTGIVEGLNSVKFISEEIGWVVGQNGKILKTTNSGLSWSYQISNTTKTLNSVFFIDENIGWVVGWDGTILKTSDSGNNWIIQQSSIAVNLNFVFFYSSNLGWIVGNLGAYIKTTNGGDTWIQKTTGTTSDLNSITFANSETGVIVGYGIILHSDDSGEIWTDVSPTYANCYSVSFSNTETGYVVGGSGQIFKSTDSGLNWFRIGSGIYNTLYDVTFTDVNTGWAVGQSGTIIKTVTGGSGYSTTNLIANASASSQVLEVSTIEGFSVGDNILINPGEVNEETNTITGFGSIYLLSPLQFNHQIGELIINFVAVSVEEEQIDEVPTAYNLSNNYPNPFNPSTKIRYSVPQSSIAVIKVFDLLGNEIATLVDEEKPIGTYEISWHTTNLPSGVYFYRLQAGSFVETKKMVLMK